MSHSHPSSLSSWMSQPVFPCSDMLGTSVTQSDFSRLSSPVTNENVRCFTNWGVFVKLKARSMNRATQMTRNPLPAHPFICRIIGK